MPQFVIAYDIHDDRRRERVARVLLDFGERVQHSVFVAWLDAEEHAELRRRVGPLLRDCDDLELFPIDRRLAALHVAWCSQPHVFEPVRVVG